MLTGRFDPCGSLFNCKIEQRHYNLYRYKYKVIADLTKIMQHIGDTSRIKELNVKIKYMT